MARKTPTFSFKGKVWVYLGPSTWYFVSLPKKLSKEIDILFSDQKRGWGSLPVKVDLGESFWETSIFPDKTKKTFILPIKKEIRIKESIRKDQLISLFLSIRI